MSGLSRTPGKRVWVYPHRGFESRPLRQDCAHTSDSIRSPRILVSGYASARVQAFNTTKPKMPLATDVWLNSTVHVCTVRINYSPSLPCYQRRANIES